MTGVQVPSKPVIEIPEATLTDYAIERIGQWAAQATPHGMRDQPPVSFVRAGIGPRAGLF